MLKFLVYSLIILSLFKLKGEAAEYWQRVTAPFLKKGNWTFDIQGEIRFRDLIDKGYHYQVRERNQYKFSKWLTAGVNGVFITSRGIGEPNYHDEYRLDLDVIPFIEINKNVSLQLRNRLEIRKKEHVSYIEERFRARQTFIFPISEKGILQDYRPSNEVFYDFSEKRFSENRFIPLEVTLKFSKTFLVRPFVMVKTNYRNLHYKSILVLGGDIVF
ncbi:DUF2490 domain-containing protein [Criblamydia sequanensis]|uniref:DUF2490 domain-containing protein n=1 Tax=Candidatus Criblamydia sequanensis CRIB-18 TaxID=1437425 RepID=A0A090D0J5_9BACT|nr:DUF2490 domain-containing protein [Criblamydia sequanensis]CDR33093.1 hypothetical protein CSEC_0254 [Criblamydia sequanensis CRIB-18]